MKLLLDTQVMKAITEDQDSGVFDDADTYGDGGFGESGYNPEDDPDAAVWAS